jgi:selenocysteine-specific elongation factor
MFVIGTSGHIDHGKTSLILSLTGTDCDRLPEEKERQMTIDIGFAGMDLPGFGTVSVIDVPGHERFIRNMVAGAWGIDMGLLVVAADDGWMPQTEDHLRVLQLLGIERIIAVLNKIDIVEPGMADLVEQQVREKLAGTPYRDADIARVSSKTGEGIAALRDTIAANLKRLSLARDADKPYLYIDRVFSSKGHGTVVTGTLRNGMLRDDDPVIIQPGNREARVKRIESHHSEVTEGSPSQRTALNLSGVPSEALRRGYILMKRPIFTGSDEIIARLQLLDRKRVLKNNTGIEVLIGTAAVRGKVIFLQGSAPDGPHFAARIKFDEAWYSYPGQPFVLTSPGGFRIIGGGMVLLPGYDARTQRDLVLEGLALFETYTLEERVAFIIAVKRRMERESVIAFFPEAASEIEAALSSLLKRGVVTSLGDYVMMARLHDDTVKLMAEAITRHVGLNMKEVSDAAGADQDICRLIMPVLLKGGKVSEKEGRYFAGSTASDGALSKSRTRVLAALLEKGGDGIELERLSDEAMKRDIRDLIKLGLLVSLDGNLIYHRDVYEKLKTSIMGLFETKDKISIPEAKDAAGLSRKYIIPLINRIERDGIIKRLGDFRVKV